jgi:nucleoside-diphosphate-sugar epimerase
LTEEITPNPKTHYGIAKLQAERYILSHTYGERVYLKTLYDSWSRKQGNLNLLYQLVAKGLPWPLGDFQNERLLRKSLFCNKRIIE